MNNFLCCFVSQFRPEGDECIMASAPPISPKCIVYHPQQHKWAEERAEKPNILLCKCTRLQAMNHNPISSCNFQPFQFPIKHHFLQLQCFQFPIKDTWTPIFLAQKSNYQLLMKYSQSAQKNRELQGSYCIFDHIYRFVCLQQKEKLHIKCKNTVRAFFYNAIA